MADNVAITAGSGTTIAADEVVDGTLGTVKVQFVKIMDGTLDGTTKASVGSNGLKVEDTALASLITSTAIPTSIFGDTAETAASSDTATSGLNGLLKRIAQNITSLIGLFSASSATLSSVASGVSSAQLLASNSSRKGAVIVNTDAYDLYIKYGTTASTSSFTYIVPAGGTWEMTQRVYTGRIDGIWAGDGSGSAYITEF